MSIRIDALTKRFDDHVIFDNLHLDIPTGRVLALTGRSGCGKTTLLRMIAGIDTDYSGQITGVPETKSFMFQEDRLLPWYDVRQNLEFVLKDVMSRDEMYGVIGNILTAVDLAGHEHKKPDKLSGGMQRRVAMARAFCYPSELLVMDEPFKGFDAGLTDELIVLFERLYSASGKTVLLVLHEPDIIARLGCEVIDVQALAVPSLNGAQRDNHELGTVENA